MNQHAASQTSTQLLATLLRPRGIVARFCATLADTAPGSELDALLETGMRLLLRALFLRYADARGLLGELPAAPYGLFEAVPATHQLASLDKLLDEVALDYAALPVRLLGTAYEELSGRRLAHTRNGLVLARGGAARGAGGMYYTPPQIVDELVEATLVPTARERRQAGGDLLALRVCDPAMGAGHFLVAAVRRLAGLLAEQEGVTGDERALRRLVAERCIYGVDRSPVAAELARVCLWLECSAPGAPLRLPDAHLRIGDSLLGIDWQRECPAGFDVLLGNPPWGAAAQEERPALRRRFPQARGETERAALFTELALELCRPGGRIGLVTPNTWLTLARRAGLRERILVGWQFELLSEHGAGTFAAAHSIVPLAVVLRREPQSDVPAIVRRGGAEYCVDPHTWRSTPGAVITLHDSGEAALLAQIEACSVPLGDIASVAYGVKTGDNAANLARSAPGEEFVPALRRAGEVRRHTLRWGGWFLRYGPHLAGYRHGPVAAPKIVVQYIRNLSLPARLVAAVDDAGRYYPLNNFSFISGGAPYDLFFLCALLCSAALNRVFALRFHDYNIKPAYLRQLPVRRIDFTTPPQERADLAEHAAGLPENALLPFVAEQLAARPERADVVHDLLAAMARRLAVQHREAPDSSEDTRVDALIDRIVWRLYGLDESDVTRLAAPAPPNHSRPGR
jgi:hypothetical protein